MFGEQPAIINCFGEIKQCIWSLLLYNSFGNATDRIIGGENNPVKT